MAQWLKSSSVSMRMGVLTPGPSISSPVCSQGGAGGRDRRPLEAHRSASLVYTVYTSQDSKGYTVGPSLSKQNLTDTEHEGMM